MKQKKISLVFDFKLFFLPVVFLFSSGCKVDVNANPNGDSSGTVLKVELRSSKSNVVPGATYSCDALAKIKAGSTDVSPDITASYFRVYPRLVYTGTNKVDIVSIELKLKSGESVVSQSYTLPTSPYFLTYGATSDGSLSNTAVINENFDNSELCFSPVGGIATSGLTSGKTWVGTIKVIGIEVITNADGSFQEVPLSASTNLSAVFTPF
jgi:hypothetical protein